MFPGKSGLPEALRRRAETGRLSHAYIISGPKGSGKEDAAKYLAAAMVCSGAGKRPCGVCADCRKAASGIHPDVITVTREEGKKELTVDIMRQVRADASVMPNEAERKVYIISEADLMNDSAQNAMLKVLEEPPAYAAFLLLAENASMLLQTVRSRCTAVPLVGSAENAHSETADRFYDLIAAGDRPGLTELIFSLEKIERTVLPEVINALRLRAVELLRTDTPIPGRTLARAVEVMNEAERYASLNVSAGHIMGLLLAEFV